MGALPPFERGDGFLRLGYRAGPVSACAWPPGKCRKLAPGFAAILAVAIANHGHAARSE